ncbi:MAG: cytochrome c oxidase assembly protein [Planctomycetaceae bacterium]|nr:cytochrome c oxidase assembly protein [Planctomycetaceae bacterium]MCP4462873.1 cytochrome c oxidase assembly protein [Planctomycetaceae bacterium]MDG1806330.1 cytochrome c oxidase assembly protein [Pirellulaceae bacterium]MDG2105071.1 cytochrome c oxidase assembly protein [Pirellulaceae bacterium]
MMLIPELWNWDSLVWLAIGIILLVYFVTFKGMPPLRRFALGLGVAFMAVAFVSPIGYLANGYVFSAHMIQHLLMLLIVPLCLILALPKQRVASWFSDTPKPQLAKALVMIGWIGGVGAMWFWHVPNLCSVSTQNASIGLLRDSSFMLAGLVFWWPIFGPLESTRLSPPSGIVYLFSACLGCTLLGIYITFTNSIVCPVFAQSVDSLGIMASLQAAGFTPMVDQNLGGLLMWVPPCTLYVGAIISLLCRWYKVLDPETIKGPVASDHEPAHLV